MTPENLIKELKEKGISNREIAENIGCTRFYVDKLGNGSRKIPSYIVMDKLRAFHQQICGKHHHEKIIS